MHMTKEVAEDYAAKMRMAFAEAGYPNAEVIVNEIEEDFEAVSGWGPEVVPSTINYDVDASNIALRIACPPEFRHLLPCDACFKADPHGRHGISFDCVKGNCANA